MLLWTLTVLIVLRVDWINFGIVKMFYITGKPTLLGPGTEVYVHYKVLFKFALVNYVDEDTDMRPCLRPSTFVVLSCLKCHGCYCNLSL